MAYTRITALWSGATGLPGYSRFKFLGDLDSTGAAAAATRVRTMFDAVKAYLPTVVNITFAEVGQIYDLEHKLTGEVAFVPPATVVGTGAGNYSAPTGCVINWITGSFSGGRKVRGRTFLVPLAGSAYFTDGTLSGATVTAVSAAGQSLAAGTPAMIVAGRSSTGATFITNITGASVPDRAAILRSRRD